MNKNTNGINNNFCLNISAVELSRYITKYYQTNFNDIEVTPVRIQKTLYFIFAYWAKNFELLKDSEIADEEEKAKLDLLSNKLFDAKFQAWIYGPVINEVYESKTYKKLGEDGKYDNFDDISDSEVVLYFIKAMLNELSKVNDFNLVNLSHEDEVWKNARAKGIKTDMNTDEIISEYLSKE